MAKKKPKHGGKRDGAGPPTKHGIAKVNYTIRLTPQVKEFLTSQSPSGSEYVESMVRERINKGK